jgi:hypothetical protein
VTNSQPLPIDLASEADLLEQMPVVADTEPPAPPDVSTVEADEADVHEQAIHVPDDDVFRVVSGR